MRPYLAGIIVPNRELLIEFALQEKIDKNYYELCEDELLTQKTLEILQNHGKNEGLKEHEIIKKLKLYPESFSSRDLLTCTYKLRRQDAKLFFSSLIKTLYE